MIKIKSFFSKRVLMGELFEQWFHRYANKNGYFKLEQIRIGGHCKHCHEFIPNFKYVYNGSFSDGFGVCNSCYSKSNDLSRYYNILNERADA